MTRLKELLDDAKNETNSMLNSCGKNDVWIRAQLLVMRWNINRLRNFARMISRLHHRNRCK